MSGFANAPISKLLIIYVVASAILVTGTDTKFLFYIQPSLHIWQYRQWWRFLTWPLAYTNSTEVLFASVALYNLRVIERIWGSRKFASFLVATLPYTVLAPPILLTFFLSPLSGGLLNYLPSGPSAIVFALLAQYHAAIPYIYRYRLATSPAAPETNDEEPKGVMLTSKSSSYLIPLQLAVSQFPGSLLPAVIGWIVGYAWRADLVLFPSTKWRIPHWLTGGAKPERRPGAQLDDLRRRMEDEAAGRATGTQDQDRQGARRRPLGSAILDRFRGAF